jgi:WD40 repeat protein
MQVSEEEKRSQGNLDFAPTSSNAWPMIGARPGNLPDFPPIANASEYPAPRAAPLPRLSIAEETSFRAHTDSIRAIAADLKTGRLTTAGDDLIVRVWGISTGERRELQGSRRSIRHVHFSESGQTLFTAGLDGTVRVWELSGPGAVPLYIPADPGRPRPDQFVSADEYEGGGRGSLPAYVTRMEGGFVQHIRVSGDGRYLRAGVYGGPITVWRLDTMSHRTLKTDDGSFSFSSDSAWLISGKALWKIEELWSGTESPPGTKPKSDIEALDAFSAKSQWVENVGGRARLHDMEAAIDGKAMVDGSFDPTNRWFARMKEDRFCVWDLASKAAEQQCASLGWTHAEGTPLVFSARGTDVAVLLCDPETRERSCFHRIALISLPTMQYRILAGGELGRAFQRCGTDELLAAAGRFGEVYVARKGGTFTEIGRHARQVSQIAFTADCNWLATGGVDRTVRLWSLNDAERFYEARFVNPIESLAFAFGDSRLAVGSGPGITLLYAPLNMDLNCESYPLYARILNHS